MDNYKELYKGVVSKLGELSDKELDEVRDFIKYLISVRKLIEPGDEVMVNGKRIEVAFFGIPSEIRKWISETGIVSPSILPALNENVKFIVSIHGEIVSPEDITSIKKPEKGELQKC